MAAPNRALGTNPFCASVPGGDDGGPALLLDMATTTIAAGKARIAYNKGVDVPEGSLIDPDGYPTNDPTGLIRDRTGALLSFGKHKGSGLAVMCEIMAGALAGGQRAEQDRKGGILNSMLAVVIDPAKLERCRRGGRGRRRARRRISGRRAWRRGSSRCCCRASRSGARRRRRAREGIPVDDGTWREVLEAAGRLGITQGEIDQAVAANA